MSRAGSQNESQSGSHSIEVALATLQPLRDLSKNWDIDIASCLEEYLQEVIGSMSPAERACLPQMESLNFSQAALLLQNSSNVYSRKVDYFHNLVFKVLEEIVQSSAGKGSSAAARKSTHDADIDEFNAFDPETRFLLLDDVLPTEDDHSKINLAESDHLATGELVDQSMATAKNNATLELSTTRLSLGDTRLANSSILDQNPHNGGTNPYILSLIKGTLDVDGFRLFNGNCEVGEDGVLLMPGVAPFVPDDPKDAAMEIQASPVGNGNQGGPEVDGMSVQFGDDDYHDHDDDMQGFVPADQTENENQHGHSSHGATALHEHQQGNLSLDKMNQHPPQNQTQIQKADPWTLLDPHDAFESKVCPLRRGTTFRLPEGINGRPSDFVTGARTKSNARRSSVKKDQTIDVNQEERKSRRSSMALETFAATLAAHKSRHGDGNLSNANASLFTQTEHQNALPTLPLKGLVFGDEFMYIAKATAKRKAAERREQRKRADDPTMVETVHPMDEADYAPFIYDDDDQNDSVGMEIEGDNDADSRNFNFDNHLDDPPPEDEGQPQTFEELCRAHVQKFAKSAEKYAVETQLTQRVGTWHEKLIPILQDEENRPFFDMRKYSEAVVDRVANERLRTKRKDSKEEKTTTVDFASVTKNCEHFDVCRLFLASLSLSNSGNVKLEHRTNAVSSLSIELLKESIDCPMEHYVAPSVSESTTQ